jgi:hypothetical protein
MQVRDFISKDDIWRIKENVARLPDGLYEKLTDLFNITSDNGESVVVEPFSNALKFGIPVNAITVYGILDLEVPSTVRSQIYHIIGVYGVLNIICTKTARNSMRYHLNDIWKADTIHNINYHIVEKG